MVGLIDILLYYLYYIYVSTLDIERVDGWMIGWGWNGDGPERRGLFLREGSVARGKRCDVM